MNKKTIMSVFASFALTSVGANAKIFENSIDKIAVEGTELKVRGNNFNSRFNPLTVIGVGPNGEELDLSYDRRAKKKFLVRMPYVEGDTKMVMKISGGNVSPLNPQEFVILVLETPEVASAQDDVVGVEVLGGSNSDSSDDDSSTTNAEDELNTTNNIDFTNIAQGIGDLPNLRFIGEDSGDLTTRSNLTVQGDAVIEDTVVANNFRGNFEGNLSFSVSDDTVDLQADGQELQSNSDHRRISVDGVNLLHLANGGSDSLAKLIEAADGQKLMIIFDENIEVIDDNAHTSNSIDIQGGDTTFTEDSVLELVYDGTSWFEVSRAVN